MVYGSYFIHIFLNKLIYMEQINNITYEKIFVHSVRKAKRDAGSKQVGDGKFRQPLRLSGPIYAVGGFFRSFYVEDGIFRHPHVLVLSNAWIFF
jgi:hypothetical protein